MSFGKFKGGDDKDKENDRASSVAAALSPSSASGRSEAFLGKGCKVVGSLHFAGPAEVDGSVEGELIGQDRLIIGESAVIKAKVQAVELIVKGTVQGDIIATRKLSLRKPARVVGNISSANLSIEEGVLFEGKCLMTAPTQSANSVTANSATVGSAATAGTAAGASFDDKRLSVAASK